MKLFNRIPSVFVLSLGLFVLAGFSSTEHNPVEWEHGWKTDHVTATRYENKVMGFNIGFVFTKNPHNADRKELSDFMEDHKGWVYHGGGYPGAEMFVVFKDVEDVKSANKKLKAILPDLSRLISSL